MSRFGKCGSIKLGVGLGALTGALGSVSVAAEPREKHPAPQWELTFADEFDAPAGTPVNPEHWNFDLGGHGWGNGELQTYTDSTENVRHDGQGNLVIEALKKDHTGPDDIPREFTSARIKSQGLFSQVYGRFEARFKPPRGNGMWPAIWMLGDTFADEGWPDCGEIDIMEYLGREPHLIHGTLHGPGYSGGAGLQGSIHLEPGQSYADDFHVVAIEWEPEEIRWYLNGELFHTRRPEDAGLHEWAYHRPHFLIMNLAVGGGWPGPPDETTRFPQQLTVDYVRVYRDTNLAPDDPRIAAAIEKHQAKRGALLEASRSYKPGVATLPGELRLMDFMSGGEGVAYHDTDEANVGGGIRHADGVDLGASKDPLTPYSVGWTQAGEWLAYRVHVPEAGQFRVTASVASSGPGGAFALAMDGRALTKPKTIPDTGGWQDWEPLELGAVALPAGDHVLRVVMLEDGPGGGVGNLSRLTFKKITPVPTAP